MTRENVALIEGLFQDSDLGKEAILAMLPDVVAYAFDPDVEWVEAPERADTHVWRGHEGIVESWRRWLEDFDEYRIELVAIEDHGDQIYIAAREHARGAASGASTTAEIFAVFWFRDAKIVRYEEFYAEEQARGRLEP